MMMPITAASADIPAVPEANPVHPNLPSIQGTANGEFWLFAEFPVYNGVS
jgi:hypothetical protein